jgi:hypothetical protein
MESVGASFTLPMESEEVQHTLRAARMGECHLTHVVNARSHAFLVSRRACEQIMSTAIELYRRWLLDASKRPAAINAEPQFFIRVRSAS